MRHSLGRALLLFGLVALAACSSDKAAKRDASTTAIPNPHVKIGNPYKIDGRRYVPRAEPDYDEKGIASWYGPQFHGRLTANGELFDMNRLTAAHKTLPLPSLVRVTNLENGKKAVLRLNDRGPFSGDRLLDLSRRAAEVLGTKDKGLGRVRVEYLGPADLDDAITRLGEPEDYAALKPKGRWRRADAEIIDRQPPVLREGEPSLVVAADGVTLLDPERRADRMPENAPPVILVEADGRPETSMWGDEAAPVWTDLGQAAPADSSAARAADMPADTAITEAYSLEIPVADPTGMGTAPAGRDDTVAQRGEDRAEPRVTAGLSGDEGPFVPDAAPAVASPADTDDLMVEVGTRRGVRIGEVDDNSDLDPIAIVYSDDNLDGAAGGSASALSAPETWPERYIVQVGVFGVKSNADAAARHFVQNLPVIRSKRGSGTNQRHIVRLGPFRSENDAALGRRAAVGAGFTDAHIVRELGGD